jgi:hypothetical protein
MENQDLQNLARDIAVHLGENWRVIPRDADWIANIGSQNGATIYVERSGDRLVVTGKFPRGEDGCNFVPHDKRPRITVRASRSPESIAGDIRRRFLPEYLPLYDEAAALWESHRRAEEQRRRELALLAEATGGTVVTHNSVRWYGEHSGKVEVRHGGYATVEVSTTVDVALKMVGVLKKGRGRQRHREQKGVTWK